MWSRELIKNKVCALVLIAMGVLSVFIDREGGTACMFLLIIGVPLFFCKENVIG